MPFGTRVFRELTNGRYVTIGRGELSRLLFERAPGGSELIFGDEIIGLEERDENVLVHFRHAAARTFDLVVGADGLHSEVRRLAFGPRSRNNLATPSRHLRWQATGHAMSEICPLCWIVVDDFADRILRQRRSRSQFEAGPGHESHRPQTSGEEPFNCGVARLGSRKRNAHEPRRDTVLRVLATRKTRFA